MNVAVLGGGIMGSGIAQVAAGAGHAVCVLDIGQAELERTRSAIESSLDRLARKDVVTPSERDATLARLRFTTDLASAVRDASAVIEAVPEELELKCDVLARVAHAAPSQCLLATNTSQLSITAIGASLGSAAERLVGMHFFNPPVLMNLIELIAGDETSEETLDRAHDFAHGLDKETVLCQKDSPGFITSSES